MPSFGPKSLAIRETLHPKLQKVVDEVVKHLDITLLQGVRTPEQEKALVASGASTTMNSKHLPDANGKSRAVDLAKFPLDWDNTEQFILVAGYVLGIAEMLGIKLVWGGDWNRDFNTLDTGFRDLDHFQLHDSEE